MFKKGYYPSLDVLRGILIIWVLFHHFRGFLGNENLFSKIINKISFWGYLSVDIFFVLSGFLLAGTFLENIQKNFNIVNYISRKISRILPEYYLFFGVSVILLTFLNKGFPLRFSQLISNLVLIQNYTDQNSYFAHTWFLAVECHFYIIISVIFAFVDRFSPNYDSRNYNFFIITTLFFFTSNILFFLNHNGILVLNWPVLEQTSHIRMGEIFAGCILRFFEIYCCRNEKFDKYIVGNILFIGGCILYVYFFLNFARLNFLLLQYLPLLGAIFILLAFYFGFWGLRIFIKNKFMIYIGTHTLGIYLWHYIVALLLFKIFKIYGGSSFFFMLLYFFLSIALGVLSQRIIKRITFNASF